VSKRGGVAARVFATIAATVLVLATAFAASIYFGWISVTPPGEGVVAHSLVPRPTTTTQADIPSGSSGAPPATTAASTAQLKIADQKKFGDWIYGCVEAPQSKDLRCFINQSLSRGENLVFFWRIMHDGKGGLANIWQTPQAVQLNRGIMLDAGMPEPIVIPYQSCGNGRCGAVANMTAEYVELLANAEKLVASIVASNGQKVDLSLSVNGLANGLAALKASTPAATDPPATTPPAN
jgi:invasion protein IalB